MKSITYIAGGSKGLGASLVQKFTAETQQVFEFSRFGTGTSHIACDFNYPNQAREIFQKTFKTTIDPTATNINLIINTAILAPFGSLQQADHATIKQHININITTTMLLLQTFINVLQNTSCKKTICYISSGAARRDIPGLAMYSASKAFFERLIDTTATEQRSCDHPFDCMIINPGVMDTDMQVEIRAQNKADFPMVDMWQELHEQGKLADPRDIAEVCFNLITHEGKNGGYYTAQDFIP